MYAYFIGTITEINEENLVLEVNNVGYNIRISGRDLVRLQGVNEEVKIYTYTYVKEDALQLYGFLTKDEITLFKMLISVSGIGPKGALAILSILDADALRLAILSGDSKSISKASGIGGKTAERVILELKDKVSLEDIGFVQEVTDIGMKQGLSPQCHDAVEALTALGYSASDALKAVKSIDLPSNADVEEILKASLKKL